MAPIEDHRVMVREEIVARLHDEPVLTRFTWRLGRRGAYLVTMGTMYILLGFVYTQPVPGRVTNQLELPLLLIPDLRIWAYMWIACGVVAIINAWWPPGRDGGGFVFLFAYGSLWGGLNLLGWLFLGADRAYLTGIIFLAFAFSVLVVSGMPDRTPVARVAVGRAEKT